MSNQPQPLRGSRAIGKDLDSSSRTIQRKGRDGELPLRKEGGVAMARQVASPHGAWPLEMRAETAAAYCDEPSVDAFMAKVERGVYSTPSRVKGCLPKWHRLKLDRDIARRHGLRFDGPALDEDVTELI